MLKKRANSQKRVPIKKSGTPRILSGKKDLTRKEKPKSEPEKITIESLNLTWKTEQRKPDDLKLWEQNPNKRTKSQMMELKRSIVKFDYTEPVIINLDNMIIGGNHRVQALLELGRGQEAIEVRVPDRKLTKREFEEIALRDNQHGSLDKNLLMKHFEQKELLNWGFTQFNLKTPKLPFEKTKTPKTSPLEKGDTGFTSMTRNPDEPVTNEKKLELSLIFKPGVTKYQLIDLVKSIKSQPIASSIEKIEIQENK